MQGWLPRRFRDTWVATAFASLIAMALSPATRGADITIAVAANFAAPMNAIAAAFESNSEHKVRLAFGSSGKLFAQIRHGAPFEAFFSADQDKITRLMAEDLAVAESRMTYAEGRLVLWSAREHLVDHEGKVLGAGQFRRLAIANPKLAPYGAAAMEVLAKLGLDEVTRGKRVVGENISQAYQYVASGNAELGLLALSQVYRDGTFTGGSGWIVPDTLYQPIRQDAAILNRANKTGKREAVDAFWNFFRGPEASAIIASYGYRVSGASPAIQEPANAE